MSAVSDMTYVIEFAKPGQVVIRSAVVFAGRSSRKPRLRGVHRGLLIPDEPNILSDHRAAKMHDNLDAVRHYPVGPVEQSRSWRSACWRLQVTELPTSPSTVAHRRVVRRRRWRPDNGQR